MERNSVVLEARIEAVEPMRVSPAGVPSVRFTVSHRSVQPEAGVPRQVELALTAVAIGPLAETVGGVGTGATVELVGFLARASTRSQWPVLHVNELKVCRGVENGIHTRQGQRPQA